MGGECHLPTGFDNHGQLCHLHPRRRFFGLQARAVAHLVRAEDDEVLHAQLLEALDEGRQPPHVVLTGP